MQKTGLYQVTKLRNTTAVTATTTITTTTATTITTKGRCQKHTEGGTLHCKKWKMGDGHLSSYFWIFIQLFLDICPADFCPAISGLMS